jgi:hypothetical protein
MNDSDNIYISSPITITSTPTYISSGVSSSGLDTFSITIDNTMNSGYGVIAQDLGTITITDNYSSINDVAWNWVNPVPFETGFPEWNDFQEMCKEYPGLEKTFEHLKVFYKLCHDEWQVKKKGKE